MIPILGLWRRVGGRGREGELRRRCELTFRLNGEGEDRTHAQVGRDSSSEDSIDGFLEREGERGRHWREGCRRERFGRRREGSLGSRSLSLGKLFQSLRFYFSIIQMRNGSV